MLCLNDCQKVNMNEFEKNMNNPIFFVLFVFIFLGLKLQKNRCVNYTKIERIFVSMFIVRFFFGCCPLNHANMLSKCRDFQQNPKISILCFFLR